MFSSFLLVFLSSFGIFSCAEHQVHHPGPHHDSKRGSSAYPDKDEVLQPHKFEMETCSNNFTSSFTIAMLESKCVKPVDTMVKLISHASYITYMPSKVRVKRCQGMCHTQNECIPSETDTKLISVYQYDRIADENMCVTVAVEQHLRCKCVCSLMEKHCNKKLQMYDQSNCECKCMDPHAMKDCRLKGFQWEDRDCACNCPSSMDCTSGGVWDSKNCMCKPTVNEDDSNDVK